MSSYIELCLDTTNTNNPATTNPVVRIELPMPCQSMDNAYCNLIKPALIASGFSESTVENYFEPEEEVDV